VFEADWWEPRSLRTRYRGYIPVCCRSQAYASACAVAFTEISTQAGWRRLLLSVWGEAKLLLNGKEILRRFSSPEFFGQQEAFVFLKEGKNRFLLKLVNDRFNRIAQAEDLVGSWGFYLDLYPAGRIRPGLFLDIPLLSDQAQDSGFITGVAALRSTASDPPLKEAVEVTLSLGGEKASVRFPALGRAKVCFRPFLLPLPQEGPAPSILRVYHKGELLLTQPVTRAPPQPCVLRRAVPSPSDGTVQLFLEGRPGSGTPSRILLYIHGSATTEEELLTWGAPLCAEALRKNVALCAPRAREGALGSAQAEADILAALRETQKALSAENVPVCVAGTGAGAAVALGLACRYPDLFEKAVLVPSNPFESLPQVIPADPMLPNAAGLPVLLVANPRNAFSGVLEDLLREKGADLKVIPVRAALKSLSSDLAERILGFVRSTTPQRENATLSFVTTRLRWNTRSYLRLEAFERWGEAASVSARWAPQAGTLDIESKNVKGLTVLLEKLPGRNQEQPVQVKWNGESVYKGIPRGKELTLGEIPKDFSIKRKGFEGPLDELLRGPYTAIAPTESTWLWTAWRLLERPAARARYGRFTGSWQLQVLPPENASPEENWLLFGGPSENPLLRERVARLPFVLNDKVLRLGSRSFPLKDHVALLVCPDPQRPGRLLGIFVGKPHVEFARSSAATTANPFAQPETMPDVVVWRKTNTRETNGTFMRVFQGWFDSVWREVIPVEENSAP